MISRKSIDRSNSEPATEDAAIATTDAAAIATIPPPPEGTYYDTLELGITAVNAFAIACSRAEEAVD